MTCSKGPSVPRENTVTTAIRRHVEAHGGPGSFVIKFHGTGATGRNVGDLVGSYLGRPFWVECKRPEGGTVGRGQTLFMRQAARGGYVTGIVRSVSDFESLFTKGTP